LSDTLSDGGRCARDDDEYKLSPVPRRIVCLLPARIDVIR
jgi:hypothetical protein